MDELLPLRVAWMAIWNREIAKPRGRKQPESRGIDEPAHKHDDDDDDDDAAGVLYAWMPDATEPATAIRDPVMARRIGLAQGLLDFARYVHGS